jgi:hypothetical protein
MATTSPPFYVLIAHSSALIHPRIGYAYADDSPLHLLPNSPEEHVVVLDYNPPTAKSLSSSIAVTALKVEDALAVADESQPQRNDRMHIIQTTAADERYGERSTAQTSYSL